MNVSEVINFAVKGEIRQLSVSNVKDSDSNRSDNIESLISYINLGILEIYKKFNLANQIRLLDDVVDGSVYNMTDDYMHLLCARDNNKMDIPINNEFSDYSIFEPIPFKLQIVKDDLKYSSSNTIYITYAAATPFLTSVDDSIPLSKQYLQALLLFISYKAHSVTEANDPNNQNAHYIRFLGACNEITNRGLMTDDNQSNNKHYERGFV